MYGCDTRIDEVTLLEPVAMDLQANTQVQTIGCSAKPKSKCLVAWVR